jgi:hypothetical protein
MKLRGRELYIIAGVVAAVICAGWYFLLFSPLQQKDADLSAQADSKETELQQAQADLVRLEGMKKSAPQTRADLVRLRKLVPAELAQPGFIVELNQTAKASGLKWSGVTTATPALGTPFSVEPFNLTFTGKYFDVEDFLWRLEDYVAFRNQDFLVTGRLFTVASMQIGVGTGGDTLQNGVSPELTVSMLVNGFIWSPNGTVPGVAAEGQ